MHPVASIASFSSLFKILITYSTPDWPLVANPHKTALPIKTTSAPNARALRTSEPFLTPPSKKTGMGFSISLTALITSGSTSIVAKVVSN